MSARKFLKELFCLHAYWCGDRDYSVCLKCGKWRDWEWDNARGRAIWKILKQWNFLLLCVALTGCERAEDALKCATRKAETECRLIAVDGDQGRCLVCFHQYSDGIAMSCDWSKR